MHYGEGVVQTGVFTSMMYSTKANLPLGEGWISIAGDIGIDASRAVLTAEENRPVNVALPVILYLGIPA